MDLVTTYTNILRAFSVYPDEDRTSLNYVSLRSTSPWTLSKEDPRRVVLPTRDVLRKAEWDKVAPWHPLSEHLNRGQSPIIRLTLRTAGLRLTEVILNLMEQLLNLAADPERQAKMSPQAQKAIAGLKRADGNTVGHFKKLVKKYADGAAELAPIALYLKRDGLYQGKRSRVCAVSSPLLNAIQDSGRKPGGVGIRIGDQEALENLILLILPDIDAMETYSAPSSSQLAPYFDSLLLAYEKVAVAINNVIRIFRKELVDVEKLKIDVDWGDLATDLPQYRSQVPPLEDSKGKVLASEAPSVESSVPAAPAIAAPAAAHVAPAAAVAPVGRPVATADTPDDELPLAERIARNQGRLVAQQYAPPPPQPVYQQPVYQQPAYHQPVPQPAPYGQPAMYQQPAYYQPVQPSYHRPVEQPQPVYHQQPGYPAPVGYPQPAYQQPASPLTAGMAQFPQSGSSVTVAAAVQPQYPVYNAHPQQAAPGMYQQPAAPAASGTPLLYSR